RKDVQPIIHIYKKPVSGWTSTNSSFKVKGFELNPNGIDIEMSTDEGKIYITGVERDYAGALVLVKNGSEWDGTFEHAYLDVPQEFQQGNAHVYDGNNIYLHDEYLIISDRFGYYNRSNAVIYVFKDLVGDGIHFSPIAPLAGDEFSWVYPEMEISMDDNNIYTSAFADEGSALHVYPKQTEWVDGNSYHEMFYDSDTIPAIARFIENDENNVYVIAENQDSTLGFYTFEKARLFDEGYLPKKQVISTHSRNFGNISDAEISRDSILISTTTSELLDRERGAVRIFKITDPELTALDTLDEKYISATGNFYGSILHQLNDMLLVASLGDASLGIKTGAVDVFSFDGTGWNLDQKIVPEIPINEYDDLFGFSIDHINTELYIGAPGFDNGKLFIYENKQAIGIDLELKQVLSPPDSLGRVDYFASAIAVKNNVLAVATHDKTGSVRYGLAIYERELNENWKLVDYKILTSVDIFNKSSSLSLEITDEGQIIVGGEVLSEGIDIYTRNNEGNYEITATLTQPDRMQFDRFGSAIRASQNHIFVSATGKDFGSQTNVGAIYVFAKPHGGWASTSDAVEIKPYDLKANGLFGLTFEVIENTLIVGASGVNEYFDGSIFMPYQDPGAAYVIQGITYDWSETIDFLKFQGESLEEPDKFGYGISFSKDNFIIGAVQEDTERGFDSGAVYTIETPPLIQLVPPVCEDNGLVNLFEYPYGGIWDGKGIIDNSEGLFDPKVAGIGTHLITYNTPNCAYEGKLKIEVLPSIELVIESGLVQEICNENEPLMSVKFNTTLNYRWYYSANNTEFTNVVEGTGDSSDFVADKPGYYYCEVFNEVCSKQSLKFEISVGDIELKIDSIAPICTDADIMLTASPQGGRWFGLQGLEENGLLKHSNLSNGLYEVSYVYTEKGVCYDTSKMTITKAKIAKRTVKRIDGDICLDGAVELSFDMDNSIASWDWYELKEQEEPQLMSSMNLPLEVQHNGEYQVLFKNDFCSNLSESIVIKDTIDYTFLPEGSELNVCEGISDVRLSVEPDGIENVTWFYSGMDKVDNYQEQENSLSHLIDQSGWYKAKIQQGNCETWTPEKYVDYYPTDSAFVPNIITVNGDFVNDTFKPYLVNFTSSKLNIYDRYGKNIYQQIISSGEEFEWNASSTSSGVYFWHINLVSHCGSKEMKGNLHIQR
ncbi:MAG: gliding motility-associated C-terminal domain-containing protein, partial [Fulvivirga sp.]